MRNTFHLLNLWWLGGPGWLKSRLPVDPAHHHREGAERTGPLDLKPTEFRSPGLNTPADKAMATEAIPDKGSYKENPTGKIVFAAGLVTRGITGCGRNVSDLDFNFTLDSMI